MEQHTLNDISQKLDKVISRIGGDPQLRSKGIVDDIEEIKAVQENQEERLDKHQDTVDFVEGIRKISTKTFYAGMVTVWGWLVAFIYYIACKIWPALKLFAILAEKHTHNT